MASPEPAIEVSTPAGTCPGRLRRHSVIGCADPGQNPSAVRSVSSRVRGRGLGSATARPVPRCRPGSGDDDQGAAQRRPRPEATRRPRQGRAVRRSPGEPGHGAAPTDGSRGRAGRDRKLQIIRLFCKPVCKPDAARQYGTGETEPTERDAICPVRRGHRTRERLSETPETHVVWLIPSDDGRPPYQRGAVLSTRCSGDGERQWAAARGTSHGTGGREMPVQSAFLAPSAVLSVQVMLWERGSGPLVMRRSSVRFR